MKRGERRKAERVSVNLNARWEGVVTQREGTVVDLSPTGCFILTADLVKFGEFIRLEIEQPGRESLIVWGEVVYQIEEMGFGLRFTGATGEEEKQLAALLKAERHRMMKLKDKP